MRLGAILNKIYWKTRLTVQALKKRRKAQLSYKRLLKGEKKRSFADVDWGSLIIDCRLDGEAASYLGGQLGNKEDVQPNSVAVSGYDRITGYTVEFIQNQKRTEYIIPSYQDLKNFLHGLRIKKIYVNELFGYDDLCGMFDLLTELKVKRECQLICFIHDCYCICPITPWGIKTVGHCTLRYDCVQCLEDKKCYENKEEQGSLYEWQRQWERFLKKCDLIIIFSQIIKDHVLQTYGELPVQVIPERRGNKWKKADAHRETRGGKEGVSICIPAYNNEEYVRRLLSSIQIQTYHDYEVVITDDSSGQEVEQVVAEYAVNMPIRYYRNRSPLGPTRNNNRAISLAERKYVKIMHHDDWFARPDSLEQLVFLLEMHQDIDLAFSGAVGFGQGRSSYEHIRRDQAELLAKDWRNLFLNNWIGAPSVTIFRNKGWLFDDKLVWRVDCELYMRILSENSRFVYTELPLVYLGISDTQLTKTCREDKELMYDEIKYIYKKYKKYINLRLWKSYTAETIRYNPDAGK